MKFTSLAVASTIMLSLMLFSCSSPTKHLARQLQPATILPAGSAPPNPYLQNRPQISEAISAKFQRAVQAIQQQQWVEAETLLNQIAHEDPTLSGAPLNLGIVYRAQGDAQRAEIAFAQAIKSNAKNLDAYNQLAVLKREQGKFAEAEALYQQALSIWPYHRDSHKNLAILYELYMGKPEQALPHYLAYQQLSSEPDKQAASWIADLQRRLGKSGETEKGQVNDEK